MYRPAGSPEGSFWEPLLENNKPATDGVQLLALGEESGVVMLDDERVLQYAGATPETVTIIKLDLRPLGLAIFGDTAGLRVGGNTLVGNYFKKVYSMIRIGD
jgi:hypothetical protein